MHFELFCSLNSWYQDLISIIFKPWLNSQMDATWTAGNNLDACSFYTVHFEDAFHIWPVDHIAITCCWVAVQTVHTVHAVHAVTYYSCICLIYVTHNHRCWNDNSALSVQTWLWTFPSHLLQEKQDLGHVLFKTSLVKCPEIFQVQSKSGKVAISGPRAQDVLFTVGLLWSTLALLRGWKKVR